MYNLPFLLILVSLMEVVSFVSLFLKQVLIILLLHTLSEVLMKIYVLLTCNSELVFLYCMSFY